MFIIIPVFLELETETHTHKASLLSVAEPSFKPEEFVSSIHAFNHYSEVPLL